MQSWSDGFRRAFRYLRITDPGSVRLRTGLTTVTALSVSMFVLTGFGHPVGHSVPAVLLGSYIAIQASAAVKDHTLGERVVTTVFLVVPGLAAVTLGVVLLHYGRVADYAFVAVLTFAVWIRRWGTRGLASGMVIYIAYFYALVLHATVDELPLLYLGICVGVGVTALVRAVNLPARPQREVRGLVKALREECLAGLDLVRRGEGVESRSLDRTLDRIDRTAMSITDWLDRNDAGAVVGTADAALAQAVFEAQVSTEQALAALAAVLPGNRDPEITRAVGELDRSLRPYRPESPRTPAARVSAANGTVPSLRPEVDSSTAGGLTALQVYRAAQAHADLQKAVSGSLPHSAETASVTVGPSPVAPSEPARRKDMLPSTRAAVQVAVAGTLASALGSVVSPDRWYWAVMTAFLVYTGTKTRGDVLVRAGERVIGTVAGVVAGMLLAVVVGHHPVGQIALVMVSVFFAFYLKAVNYVFQTFFMTVMLAGLYGLLGEFSLDLLMLRIEETAVGAVVGFGAAYLVLTSDTRAAFRRAVDSCLAALADLIEQCADVVGATRAPSVLVEITHTLDERTAAVSAAARPLLQDPAARDRRTVSRLEQQLRDTVRAAHVLAQAAVSTVQSGAAVPSEEGRRALEAASDHVRRNVQAVRDRNAGAWVASPDRSGETLAADLPETSDPGTSAMVGALILPLARINRSMVEMLV